VDLPEYFFVKKMVSENDVVKFLMEHGESTLEEISSSLKIPKYGPNSAYAFLYSLKLKNIVEKRGGRWILVRREENVPKENGLMNAGVEANVEGAIDALSKAIREATLGGKISATPITVNVEGCSMKVEEAKTLKALKTGTFLDSLVLGFDGKPLGGIPASGQFMIVGPLGAGKSLLASEISLKLASSGHGVLYVLLDDSWRSEAQTFDLHSRMKIKSDLLNLDWNRVAVNLHVLNPRSINEEIIGEFREIISGVDLMVLDPVNCMVKAGDYRLAEELMAEIIDANRFFGVTGIFIAHTSMHNAESFIGRMEYFMDGVLSMSPAQIVVSGIMVNVKGFSQLRVIQVTSCRLCGFDNNGVLVNIMCNGVIQPIAAEKY
jgi:KaiC/GvpD/RAD55 family RecA-like ATPase